MLGNKIFILELLQVWKASLNSLGPSIALNPVEEFPGDAGGNGVEWGWHVGVSVCALMCQMRTDFKRGGKTCLKNRCNTVQSKGPCLIFAHVWARSSWKMITQITPIGWEDLIFCASFLALLWALQAQRGGWRDLYLAVCWPESLVTVCLHCQGTDGLWSSSSSLNNQPIWSQESTLQCWLGLEVIFNFVTKTNVSFGSYKWFYWWY